MKYILLFLLILISHTATANDSIGTALPHQLMLADPYMIKHDGRYYIYGTEANDGIVVYSSRDMKSWSKRCGNANNGLAMHKDDVWGNSRFWAPEVYRHGDKFIMTYSSDLHICAAESSSPCGPFTQKEQRPYLPDEEGIDASIFIDDDGTPYIFWVRFMRGGNIIWVAEMTPDLMNIRMETAREIIDAQEGTWEKRMGRIAEGPMTFKHKGKYYLTYSCNDYRSQEYAVGFAVADNPLGPYKRYGKNPILHRHRGYAGTGHHAIFRDGRRLYMVYHAHKSHSIIHPRQTLIAPMKMRRDRSGGKGAYTIEVSKEITIPKINE